MFTRADARGPINRAQKTRSVCASVGLPSCPPATVTRIASTASALNVSRVQEGLSLLELVAIIAVLAALSIYSLPRLPSSGSMTIRTQAERMANDLRAARFSALSTGKKLCVRVDDLSYGIYEVEISSGSLRCTTNPWKDSVTQRLVTYTLQNGVSFKPITGPLAISPLIFGEYGKPSTAAEYELTANGSTLKVTITAFTGHITISP